MQIYDDPEFFRVYSQMDRSRHGLSAADLTLENTKQTVKYQTTEAYYNVLQRKNLVKVAESAVRMSSEQLRLIEAQFSEGAVARSDVLQMQVQLANYRQNFVNAEGALAVAKKTLLAYIGLPRDAEIEATDISLHDALRLVVDCVKARYYIRGEDGVVVVVPKGLVCKDGGVVHVLQPGEWPRAEDSGERAKNADATNERNAP